MESNQPLRIFSPPLSPFELPVHTRRGQPFRPAVIPFIRRGLRDAASAHHRHLFASSPRHSLRRRFRVTRPYSNAAQPAFPALGDDLSKPARVSHGRLLAVSHLKALRCGECTQDLHPQPGPAESYILSFIARQRYLFIRINPPFCLNLSTRPDGISCRRACAHTRQRLRSHQDQSRHPISDPVSAGTPGSEPVRSRPHGAIRVPMSMQNS